jgi:hypothetical protein
MSKTVFAEVMVGFEQKARGPRFRYAAQKPRSYPLWAVLVTLLEMGVYGANQEDLGVSNYNWRSGKTSSNWP